MGTPIEWISGPGPRQLAPSIRRKQPNLGDVLLEIAYRGLEEEAYQEPATPEPTKKVCTYSLSYVPLGEEEGYE